VRQDVRAAAIYVISEAPCRDLAVAVDSLVRQRRGRERTIVYGAFSVRVALTLPSVIRTKEIAEPSRRCANSAR